MTHFKKAIKTLKGNWEARARRKEARKTAEFVENKHQRYLRDLEKHKRDQVEKQAKAISNKLERYKRQNEEKEVERKARTSQPGERKRTKEKPPRSYYWPQSPPANSRESAPPKRPPVKHPTPRIAVPKIRVTAPSDEPPRTSRTRSDPTRLIPPVPPKREKREKHPKARLPAAAKPSTAPTSCLTETLNRAMHAKAMTSPFDPVQHAPKPSLFSYNLCDHPRCPIGPAHEKEVFKAPAQARSKRETVRKGNPFGQCSPPFWVWGSYHRTVVEGDVGVEDKDVVEGFLAAHPSPEG